MKRAAPLLVAALAALAFGGCTVTLPRNPTSIIRTQYPALTVYTNERIYRYSGYDIQDSILRGSSQLYKPATETLAKGALDDRYPPVVRKLGLKSILRIDAEDTYDEPAVDNMLYLAVPAVIMFSILAPIIIREQP